MKRWDIINLLLRPGEKYLEIGIDERDCFDRIHTVNKLGIDPYYDGAPDPNIKCIESDLYFKEYSPRVDKFQVIFVDGDHREAQVEKDIQNATKYTADNGAIIIHDCCPTEMLYATDQRAGIRDKETGEVHLAFPWFGTVWRVAVKLAYNPKVNFVVCPDDCGIGILRTGEQKIPEIPIELALDPQYFAMYWRDIYRIME